MKKMLLLSVVLCMAGAGFALQPPETNRACQANAADKVDVYAIKDPKAALAALRQKWPGVADRVSQYDMPDFTEKVREMEDARGWSLKDITNRLDVFLGVAHEGIRLRTEPPRWYYDAACAWGLKGRKSAALEFLEKAIAAGYDDIDHMLEDTDLELLHGDARFKKLAAMGREIPYGWERPQKYAAIKDDRLCLNDKDIYWLFVIESYGVLVTNATKDTLIYLDHSSEKRNQPPTPGMVSVEFAEKLQNRGRTIGAANFNFTDANTAAQIPTLLECDSVYPNGLTNFVHSIPALTWCDSRKSANEINHLEWNVLGVYTIGDDYGRLGVDRVPAWSPASLVCRGSNTADLVRICAEAWKAMKPEVREKGGVRQLLGIVRRGQKCVTNETAFMSGAAMRPALTLSDLDEEKILKIAHGLEKPYPEIPVIFNFGSLEYPSLVCNLFEEPFTRLVMAYSIHHLFFVPRTAEKTTKVGVSVLKGEKDELVWKVLQGDASKVRIVKDKVEKVEVEGNEADGVSFTIESDYQAAFDVTLADGTKMKSTRVDVGCFRVVDGVASMPAIVSIFYMPAETREYGADGLLKSIDYAKRQIPGWMPKFCPKGGFRDEFHWNKDGKLTGWTRVNAEGQKTEFTRDGLVVMTRDELGRPLDARRDLSMEWAQQVKAKDDTDEAAWVQCGMKYDALTSPPDRLALAWTYAYKDRNDAFGEACPKEVVPFRYLSSLCTRAEFTEASGFRLPLLTQMSLGYQHYTKFKYGAFGDDGPDWVVPSDYLRPDSPITLAEKGLKVPATLKRMQFCAWKASTNDVWQLDMEDFEAEHAELLRELPEGAYRLYVELDDGSEPHYVSVRETYFLSNTIAEDYAYAKLDRTFRRCGEAEVKKTLESCMDKWDWTRIQISEGKPLLYSECPKGIDRGLALWQISKGVYFGVLSKFDTPFGNREYFFVHVDADKKAFAYDAFEELPSRAHGNTVLRAYAGDAEALNNLAVLHYSEVVNRTDYDEANVVMLLGISKDLGCEQAKRNLDVLRYNRGEKETASRRTTSRRSSPSRRRSDRSADTGRRLSVGSVSPSAEP